MNSEREIYEQLKKMAINEAVASSGKDSITRNVGFQIDKIIDLALTLSANRQGYKLVPVENIKSIYEACNNALDINNTDIYKGLAMAIIDDYEAMIGEETK